jgi:hypothetical protein
MKVERYVLAHKYEGGEKTSHMSVFYCDDIPSNRDKSTNIEQKKESQVKHENEDRSGHFSATEYILTDKNSLHRIPLH